MSEERVRVKICGLYRACDVEYVNRWKPDYAGFVHYPPSHRHVETEELRQLRALLSLQIPAVGVFVDEEPELVAQYLKEGLIQIAQLHGHEDEAYLERLRQLAPDCTIWKAFRIRSAQDLEEAGKSIADRVLLDNGYGTGACFDWSLLQECALERPFLLAGGLNAENVREAVERFHPWGVDVSSGAETEKRKDAEKIRRIIETVRRI